MAATIFAAVAAVAAVVGLYFARGALREAGKSSVALKEATVANQRTAEQAELSRQALERSHAAFERERKRERLERIGAVCEDIFRITYNAPDKVRLEPEARHLMNQLRQLVSGLKDDVPKAAGLPDAGMNHVAYGIAGDARHEIETAIARLDADEATEQG